MGSDAQNFFNRHWLPQLANAYVLEKKGGLVEVKMTCGNDNLWVDNVGKDGRMYENKVGRVAGGGHSSNELVIFKRILESVPGSSLDYNFFRSPSTDEVGPTGIFANELVGAMVTHDIGENFYCHDWWEEFQ